MPASARRSLSTGAVGRSIAVATAYAAAAALLYVVAVRLGVGQEADDLGYEARKSIELGVRRGSTFLLRYGSPLFLLAGSVAAIWLCWRRRSAVPGLAVGASVGLVAAAARLLKQLLERPDLLEFSWAGAGNSYPSGHSSTVTAMALGVVGLARTTERSRFAAAMAVLIGLHSVGMVASGWHRPSDVLAGLLLGAAAATAVLPLVVDVDGPLGGADAWYLRTSFVLRSLGGAAAGVIVVLLALRHTPAVPGRSFLVFVVMAPAVGAVGASLVIVHARRCWDAASGARASVTRRRRPAAEGTSHRAPS